MNHELHEFFPRRSTAVVAAIGTLAFLFAGGNEIGLVNLNSEKIERANHLIPGSPDPTAPDITCSTATRDIVLGQKDVPVHISDLVHSTEVIPGAYKNEQQAGDAVADINPDQDLRITQRGMTIKVPVSCE